MLTLGIENSSPRSSLALVKDGEELRCENYQPEPRNQEQIFDILNEVLAATGVACADIERYVVGIGPGNYTGMRIAMAMARALALPDDRPVIAISSGAALAKDILRSENLSEVAIVGDARRARFWLGNFRLVEDRLAVESDWQLYDLNGLRSQLPSGAMVASSEMDRLTRKLPFEDWNDINWIGENRYPSAATLIEIANLKSRGGEKTRPLQPLYMHPPV